MATTWRSPNSMKEAERTDGGVPPQESAKPATVEAVVQSKVIDSYASRWESQRIDQIKNRRISQGYVTLIGSAEKHLVVLPRIGKQTDIQIDRLFS